MIKKPRVITVCSLSHTVQVLTIIFKQKKLDIAIYLIAVVACINWTESFKYTKYGLVRHLGLLHFDGMFINGTSLTQ